MPASTLSLPEEIAALLGAPVASLEPLSGGCVGQVLQVELADGRRLVAKVDDGPAPKLEVEGYMLAYLAAHSRLPLPALFHVSPRLLLMAFLPGQSHFDGAAQAHAAELLAELHQQSAPAFGLERDTLIGGLPQPNLWTASWLAFFRDQRLLAMGRAAHDAGILPATLLSRLERFAAHLERWLAEPEQPALIHGDVWGGNVLAQDGRITGFLDPAIYYADPEIELAFTTLFGTFGEPFFRRYQEIRPLRPGFFPERRDIYNLYPLLVHVRLFGGSYLRPVEQTLRRFGF